MKINWKQKLSSRKFWAAFAGFITTILVAFNVPNLTIEQVVAIIGGVGTLAVYILTEGIVDSSRSDTDGYK